MLKNNMRYKGETGPFKPLEEREYRLVPSSRIVSRCNLDKYNVDAPLTTDEVRSDRLFLKLRQHIGKPAEVCVSEGDNVKEGTLLASVNYGDVGANIHSSADGVVEKIQADGIWIKTNVEV
jgi:Na+-translocating ferredoxin:NAD+ oxidoreductase RnfC subunit